MEFHNFLQSASLQLNIPLDYVRRKSKGELAGMSSGFKNIDSFTGGLGKFAVLGGPPKIGKSTLALNIAQNAVRNGATVIYMDHENGPTRLLLKTLSRSTRTSFADMLRDPSTIFTPPDELTESLREEFEKEYSAFTETLYIHRPNPSDFLKPKSNPADAPRQLFQKYHHYFREEIGLPKSEGLLIVIDSLQKLPIWNMSDRRSCLDIWLRAIEWARDEFDITFLVVSELSRGTYDSCSLDSFKESGDIEYSADLALQLKRTSNDQGQEVLELHAVANRDGASGPVGAFAPNWELGYLDELPNHSIRREYRSGNGRR